MSEGNDELAKGSWWGSWLDSAKAKTSTVFEAVKKDLDELSAAVRTEASNVGAALESSLKFDEDASTVGTVKKSLSSFFGQVTEALVPSLEDDEVEAVLITHDGAVTLSGFPRHLAELQMNEKTFVEEPVEELAGKYKRWMEVIEQDQFTQNQLNRHLASSEILNEKYLSLVPDKVSHMEFWKRYLFKRALLQDAIANAELVERKAKTETESMKTTSPAKAIIQTEQPKLVCNEKELNTTLVPKTEIEEDELLNEEINWENEEINRNIELSEEEQTRLLEEYEQEINEREKQKSLVLNEEVASQIIKTNVKTTTKQSPKKSGQPEKKPAKQTSNESKKNPAKNSKINVEKPTTKKPDKQNKPTNKDKLLSVQKNHFNKEENSSTSDESWEKDFDLDE